MKVVSIGAAFHERDEDYARQIAALIRASVARDGIEADVRVVTYVLPPKAGPK